LSTPDTEGNPATPCETILTPYRLESVDKNLCDAETSLERMFFLDEVYATKCIQKPVDLQSDRRRSRSSSPGIRDGLIARSRGVSISSLEQRDQPTASKRNSIFSLRPKSSLTNHSSDGSIRSRSPAPASGGTQLKSSSTGVERPTPSTEGDGSQSRSVFARNIKNSWATFRPPSPMDADDEGETRKKSRTLQKKSSSAERKAPPNGD
jgi:hypothetical protein